MRHFGMQLATAIALATTLAGCGATVVSPALRQTAGMTRASVPTDAEKAIIHELGMMAQQALTDADAAYSALKLDTAAGRKLTPKKEPEVREGLRPVVARFEADTKTLHARLEEGGTPKLMLLSRDLDMKGPAPGDVLAPEATASDMLYRIAQYRVKFGAMVEYAHRKGLMPQTPTWKDKPASREVIQDPITD